MPGRVGRFGSRLLLGDPGFSRVPASFWASRSWILLYTKISRSTENRPVSTGHDSSCFTPIHSPKLPESPEKKVTWGVSPNRGDVGTWVFGSFPRRKLQERVPPTPQRAFASGRAPERTDPMGRRIARSSSRSCAQPPWPLWLEELGYNNGKWNDQWGWWKDQWGWCMSLGRRCKGGILEEKY